MRYSQLTEAIASDIAVFYGGRFQPMHKAHHKVYMNLVEQFGSNNVFIATMLAKNAVPEDNPFSFDESWLTLLVVRVGVGSFPKDQNSLDIIVISNHLIRKPGCTFKQTFNRWCLVFTAFEKNVTVF